MLQIFLNVAAKKRVPQHPYIKTKEPSYIHLVLIVCADPFFQCGCKLYGIFIGRVNP